MTRVMSRMLKLIVPMPIRQLPWRAKWVWKKEKSGAMAGSYFRLMIWTVRELFCKELEFSLADGTKVATMRNNFVGLFSYISGNYEPHLVDFLKKSLRPDGVFVDVGANVGVYSLSAARVLSERGQIISIEAHPYTFDFLKRNMSNVQGCNVVLVNAAAGNTSGTASFNYDGGNSGSSHVSNSSESSVTVPVKTLDQILDESCVHKVSYMKIDVEGFEPLVLEGAEATLKRNPCMIIQMEIDARHLRRYGFAPSVLVHLLSKYDFKPHQIENGKLVPVIDPGDIEYGDYIWTGAEVGS